MYTVVDGCCSSCEKEVFVPHQHKNQLLRAHNKRYPRYHKYMTGKVFYVEAEFAEDIKGMEVEV